MFILKATEAELKKANEFMKTPPVSFIYGGVPFPAGFAETENGYESADGRLNVAFPFETHSDSASVTWLPRFTCTGEDNTQQIQNIKALDRTFSADGQCELYYTNGTAARIDDFGLNNVTLGDEPFVLESEASRHHLPFMNLVTGSGGVLIGLGFTSYWKATFSKTAEGVHVTVETRATDFYLKKGESVRNILMLLIFWQGDREKSFNLLRNHLVLYYIPKDENGEPYPPICCITWGGMKTENHLKYLKFLKDNHFAFDCYWMDSGWQGPDHETDEYQNCYVEDWAYHHGDWRVNKTQHPNGLKPIADAAAESGMFLLLWFGPYIANEGIGWAKEHPEWRIDPEHAPRGGVGANPKQTTFYTINIADPAARAWLSDRIATTIKENGVRGYREDCPVPDVPREEGRAGYSEMKKVEYFYEFWDNLREMNPGLLIDNCGGGGSRIDLETLKRSYVLWRSDYNCHPDEADPIGSQVGNYGLGHFIPLINGAPPSNPGSTYTFLSGLYGGMGFGMFHPVGFGEPEKHTSIPDNYPVEWHKKMLSIYQTAKPYLSGSFYPLTGCSTDTRDMLAYEFYRPDLGGGLIVGFFRQDCEDTQLAVCAKADNGEYTFEDLETGETFGAVFEGGQCALTLERRSKPYAVALKFTAGSTGD